MITVPGTLQVKTISGQNGDFAVGRLSTSIGDFSIKDTLLDQYDEGEYTGNFVITNIYPASYTPRNKPITIIEIRATLAEIFLDDFAEGAVLESFEEPDPMDQPAQPTPVDASEVASPSDRLNDSNSAIDTAEPENFNSKELLELFGSLWPLTESVKLDPTIDRGVFRKQRDYLKSHGYRFDSALQAWNFTGTQH